MDIEMENTINPSSIAQASQEEIEMDYIQDLPTLEEKSIEEILMGMDLQKLSKEWT